MPRRIKIPLNKSKPKVRYLKKNKGQPEMYHDYFCGECGSKPKIATTQRNAAIAKREMLPRNEEVARVCDNTEKHKSGKKHFWPIGQVIIHDY